MSGFGIYTSKLVYLMKTPLKLKIHKLACTCNVVFMESIGK